LGGILSCGLTHTAVTPVDMVKCNKQNNPELFNKGMFGNMGILAGKKGPFGLVRGWAPTLVGYSFQGLGKFGLYEFFKCYYGKAIGKKNAEEYRSILYMCSSASAEFFADILLCPWETVKLKVQTVEVGEWLEGKSKGYASGLFGGSARLMAEEGTAGAFKILGALWSRQIPYTIIKFVAFEAIIERIYGYTVANWGRDKASFGKAQQLGFTFLAGYSAGVICGAVSHPADTMASLIAKHPNMESKGKVGKLYTMNGGFPGLWKGFGPRVFMIGTLTALQWYIYDSVKVAFEIPTTGAAKKKE